MKNNIEFTKIETLNPPELKGLILLVDYADDDPEYTWARGYFNNGNYYVDGNKPTKLNVIAWAEINLDKSNVNI